MTVKSNQGMRQPQLGGIGSRLDVGLSQQVCSHLEPKWRLRTGGKWICAICHPPAPRDIEWEIQ